MAGTPFTVIHVASNVILLGLVAPFVVKSVRAMLGEVEVEEAPVAGGRFATKVKKEKRRFHCEGGSFIKSFPTLSLEPPFCRPWRR
ncbi:MAG: hypothetical protein KIH01_00990 [Candidatus Freyarchaeota archaeon]|nr:hypothetical protein [Candidatus Jordarchaeia archaeon]